MRRALLALSLFLVVLNSPVEAYQDTSDTKSQIDESKFESFAGFQNFYWDDAEGKIYLQIDKFEEPLLYVSSLATGLGSNPVGLDRGQLGESRVVRFRRVGKRVFLVQENLKFRATTISEAERRAIRESFAEAILWSGEHKTNSLGAIVVDITSFLLRDAHDCVGTLARTGQGTFSLDKDRSYVHLPRCKAFPENTEFEVALTFASSKPGPLATQVAADGNSVTLRQHHSFVQLPDDGYRPRKFDPRTGSFAVGYADYGVPIDQPLEQRFITRHRLQKADPGASRSSAREPIVYYVDPGVPQPVREALIEGASWWNAAFEEAGFENAFQVKVLPEDADPMDVRYNMIQWVHRATRGWSYGQSVIDPRTGEIIKGHVLLGSLRVRQDHLLFEGLQPSVGMPPSGAAACGMGFVPDEAYLSQLDPNLTSVEVALARIRQLSAHEVGHTLGFAHNFAASTYADRASVMDYPAPRTKITEGKLDLSDAYGVGIGDWDKFAVKYAYAEFSAGAETAELSKLVDEAINNKMLYVTDADARPAGAAHPLGNLWDNGTDPVAALRHEMQVRKLAIEDFGIKVLADGEALADLEKAFVPIYLHHRYQVDATSKMLGGYEYTYAVKGDSQVPQAAMPVVRQREALRALLTTLEPAALTIPQRILDLLPPRVGSSASDNERFSSQTAPVFDPASAIEAAAGLTLANLLQPQRASRLVQLEHENWGLSEVIDSIMQPTLLGALPQSPAERAARRIVQSVFVDKLIELAANASASDDARGIARTKLFQFKIDSLNVSRDAPDLERAHGTLLRSRIDRFLASPAPAVQPERPIELPPGSPIGETRLP